MVKKEDARVLRTKKNIEETTITLLTTQPNFSITLLLRRADVTRGTFYKYYQNKEHLISEVNHTLIQEFIQYTQGKFHVAEMIQAVSDRAAFYNAVLNLHSNSVYVKTLMSRMRMQMQSQLGIIEDEELYRHQMFQWEIITGGFWALISKWLLDNMNVTQTKLLQEFIEVLRVDSTGWTQTGLNLFDFDNVN
ncbi:TetR/AcrR family transcriptional regulator [Leuconostoc gelidum]|uniref:TetR/AcrR family transcriptional regulator n=1 Tax=Leuconostoc gelidum TaxID=1244 RepID=UPI001C7D0419|nr:TetR/AcrR family transcriptional regulator [Leuconostoc gelidum]MBZ6008410.1 TetR/AcrR family transcriptional regulator [Leuconostoc gelidum subsp. aenigmaticum]MBZ6010729.1 TetR/AcrR family transcriptional regulator [Leuconostoc gelidum subsp. aenigmaticum]